MRFERDDIERKLLRIIDKYDNKKTQNKIINYLREKGYTAGEINDVILKRENEFGLKIYSLSEMELCLYYKAYYDTTEDGLINPKNNFTEQELIIAEQFKVIKEEEDIYPIIFEEVGVVNEGKQWQTKITIQRLVELYRKGIMIYNPLEQRQSKLIKSKDGKWRKEIFIKESSVSNIEKLLVEDNFISNIITFNIQTSEDTDFVYIPEERKIIVRSGKIGISDGWHRSKASLRALLRNPDINFNWELRITFFPSDKVIKFIEQEDKRNPIDKKYLQAVDSTRVSNLIVERLNDIKGYLRGKITKDTVLISDDTPIFFNTLSDSIELIFNPEGQSDILRLTNYLNEGFNRIIELTDNEIMEYQNDIIWIACITILKHILREENRISNRGKSKYVIDEDMLIDILSNINFEKLCEIKYTKINATLINKIKDVLELQEVVVNV
jgi:hypothetical protein